MPRVLLILLTLTTLCQAWSPEELRVVQLVNEMRHREGLQPVRPDNELAEIARSHSEDMVRLGFYSHISPVEGKRRPNDRARLAGYPNLVAENICIVPLSARNPGEVAFEKWKKSDGHAANMINVRHELIGVGVVKSPKGYYCTQLFSGEYRKKGGARVNMVFNKKGGKALPPASLNTDPPYTLEDKTLARNLVRARMNRAFPQDQTHDYRNARAFLYLAEQHSDPAIARSALLALGRLYSRNPKARARFTKPAVGTVSYRRLPIDKNLKRVLSAALASENKQMRDAAYGVQMMCFGKYEMDAAVEKALADSVKTETGREKEHALQALARIEQRSELRDKAVLEALKGEDEGLILAALMAFPRKADISPVNRKALLKEGYRLCQHSQPGIRAVALNFVGKLARTGSEKASHRRALDIALFDTVPGVRERAAFRLGRDQGVGSIVHLVQLSGDMAVTKNFRYSEKFSSSMMGLERVGDQAMRALHELTKNLEGVEPFRYQLIDSQLGNPTNEELKIMLSESVRAREWLQSQRSALPKQFR